MSHDTAMKMQMVRLGKYANWPHPDDRTAARRMVAEAISDYPSGLQQSRGITFALAEGAGRRVVCLRKNTPAVEIPLNGVATFICVLHSWLQCPEAIDVDTPAEGRPVGAYTLIYADGTRFTQPIRAQFELPTWASAMTLLSPCLALPANFPAAVALADSAVARKKSNTPAGTVGISSPGLFLYALPNPQPTKEIKAVQLAGYDDAPLIVAGLTLYQGAHHPLQYLPRCLYQVKWRGRPKQVEAVEVDLGVLMRCEQTSGRCDLAWLQSPYAGMRTPEPVRGREKLFEITGAPDATVAVTITDHGKPTTYRFSLGDTYAQGKSRVGDATLEAVGRRRQWVTVRVIDGSTGQPTPVRIHCSGGKGEYLPLHGHPADIDKAAFHNFYMADLVIGGRYYAYVPGEFTTDFPVGDVYIELYKGFEYETSRQKVTIAPGQQTLELTINRWIALREQGWITGDTHVHVKSTERCWLEGQAEGLNIVHLLAFQAAGWPAYQLDDVTGGIAVDKQDTIVSVGTENLSDHFGHVHFIGMPRPVAPLNHFLPTAGSPPPFRTLTECAIEVKRQGGLVIRAHFPYCGKAEDPLLIMHGLLDAVEINTAWDDGYAMKEWYRYLNCGYRIAVAGGSDICEATRAIGDHRTYVQLAPGQACTFAHWAAALRAGRTYTTTGPLLTFTVDGHALGDSLQLAPQGGMVEVVATGACQWPLGKLEVVYNGRVVATAETHEATGHLWIREHISIPASGWIAVRAYCREGHPAAYMSAHSSPIYLTCGSARAFDRPAAEHLLALVQGGREYLDTIATPADAAAKQRMLGVFLDAQRVLERRIADATSGELP